MTDLVTLTAYQLSDMLRKVAPHIGRYSIYPAIAGVRLDYDGHRLHAIATDRYTLAVARQNTASDGTPWALTIGANDDQDDIAVLTTWLDTHPGEDLIRLTATTNGLTATGTRGTLTLPTLGENFPDWRSLVRTALHNEPTEAPFSGALSDLLARWEYAGCNLTTWQPAFDKPTVVYGHNFVGLQMPRRISEDESPASRWEEWRSSLTAAADGPADTPEYQHGTIAEEKNVVPEAVVNLLKQVLRSTNDMLAAATNDSAALAAYALAGGRAWLAYRLLKALEKADPRLLRATLHDTGEQLESGEIGEWAWEEAQKAGHDPQQWHDDYSTHLEARAAKTPTA